MNSPETTHAEPPPPNSQTQASGAPKGKEKNHTSAIPLRITEGLKALVSAGAARLELSEQETIRIATRVGLERLARIDWNLAAALEDAAGGAPETRMRECSESAWEIASPLRRRSNPWSLFRNRRRSPLPTSMPQRSRKPNGIAIFSAPAGRSERLSAFILLAGETATVSRS